MREATKSAEMETEAIISTEDPVKAKTMKSKLPTKETKNITTSEELLGLRKESST